MVKVNPDKISDLLATAAYRRLSLAERGAKLVQDLVCGTRRAAVATGGIQIEASNDLELR